MPDIIKYGFSGGVFSPKLRFRTDLKKYELGLSAGRNFFIEYTGGASTRAGFEFLDYIQDDDEPARIVEFAFNRDIANTYAIIFSKNRIRFMQDGAFVLEAAKTITVVTATTITIAAHGYVNGDWIKIQAQTYEVTAATANTFELLTPFGAAVNPAAFVGATASRIYTIASPYATADLEYLTFSQHRDELYINHTDYAERKLIRAGTTNWSLTTTTYDLNSDVPTGLAGTASASGSAGAIFAVTAVDFDGKETHVGSSAIIAMRSLVNYAVTSGSVTLTWSAPATPPKYYKVYRSLLLSDGAKANFGMELGYIGRTFGRKFTDNNIIPDFASPPPQLETELSGGQLFDVRVTSGGTGYTDAAQITPVGPGTGFSGVPIVESGVIVGVRVLNPGYGYSGSPVSFTTTVGTGAVIEGYPTSNTGNYPATSAMVQQRRVRAGTNNHPGTVFGSRVGEPDNYYTSGAGLAAEPYTLTLDTEQLTPIRFVLPYSEGMFIFHETGVSALRGIDDGVIKPGAAKATPITEEGSARVPPVRIGRSYLYLSASSAAVIALSPTNIPTYYSPEDISIYSEQFFSQDNRIKSWAWARAPHKLLFAVREDGTMLTLTYAPEQEVIAWSEHDTQGAIETIETVFENHLDRLYAVIRRTVNGVSKRYIERMAVREVNSPDEIWSVDSGLATTLSYQAAEMTLRDAADTGTYTTVPPEGSLVLSAPTLTFTSADVGKIFRLGYLRGTVTSFIDSTSLMIAVQRGLETLPQDYRNLSEVVWPANSWSLTATFSSVSGLHHLEGKLVEVLGDGNVLDSKIVTNGSIALSSDVSLAIVGLGFSGELQSLPQSVGNPVIENKLKAPKALAVRLYNARGLEFGAGSGDILYPLAQYPEEAASTIPVFKTGIYEVSLTAGYDLDGIVFVKKTGPLAATVLGYVIDSDFAAG